MVSIFTDLKKSHSAEELKNFGDIPYKCYWTTKGYPIKKVIEEGRIPLSTAGLMERRLEVMNGSYDRDIKNFWWETNFETSDGIFHGPSDGQKGFSSFDDIKIVRHSKQIINQQIYNLLPGENWLFPTKHWVTALKEGEKIYQSLEGVEIKSDKFYDLINKRLIVDGKITKETFSNEILLALADNDSFLLEKYLNAMEREYYEINPAMSDFRIHVEDRIGGSLAGSGNTHIGHNWSLQSLGMWGGSFNGGCFGKGDFLVGILPEKADKYNNRDARPETIEKIRNFFI